MIKGRILPYRELYNQRQKTVEECLPRQWYVEDALSLQWVGGISLKAFNEMPVAQMRGYIVRHKINTHTMAYDFSVRVAEGMSVKEERFVVIKELMHCYFDADTSGESVNSEIVFDKHLREFFGNSARSPSLHKQSESQALWMAFGVICPERTRLSLKRQLKSNDITIEIVSDRLGIEPPKVKTLFSEQFEDEISTILN